MGCCSSLRRPPQVKREQEGIETRANEKAMNGFQRALIACKGRFGIISQMAKKGRAIFPSKNGRNFFVDKQESFVFLGISIK